MQHTNILIIFINASNEICQLLSLKLRKPLKMPTPTSYAYPFQNIVNYRKLQLIHCNEYCRMAAMTSRMDVTFWASAIFLPPAFTTVVIWRSGWHCLSGSSVQNGGGQLMMPSWRKARSMQKWLSCGWHRSCRWARWSKQANANGKHILESILECFLFFWGYFAMVTYVRMSWTPDQSPATVYSIPIAVAIC